jgi:hypothetical protein
MCCISISLSEGAVSGCNDVMCQQWAINMCQKTKGCNLELQQLSGTISAIFLENDLKNKSQVQYSVAVLPVAPSRFAK